MTDAARLLRARRWPRLTADALLAAGGISAAAASTTFASYMLVFGPTELTARSGSGFGVFAQFDRRPRFAATRDDRSGQTMAVQGTRAPAPDAAEIDYTPTGSIAAAPTGSRPDAVPVMPTLADFVLRDVVNGTAVVESRNKLSTVKPGSMLAGAGEVRAIQRDGADWVVLTDRGAILQRPAGR